VRQEITEVLDIDIFFLPTGKEADIVPLQKTPDLWLVGIILPFGFHIRQFFSYFDMYCFSH
jgi:hypothetical protein